MFFFPIGCVLALLFLLLLPVILTLAFLNLVSFSFGKLGLPPAIAILVLLLTLIGSAINIPLTRRKMEYARDVSPFAFFRRPQISTSGLAINVGGAIVPLSLSAYLLTIVSSPWPVLAATAVMTLVSKRLARPIPGVGIGLPMFVPPVFAALLAVLLSPGSAAPCAYIAGTVGTLLGADLLNLRKIERMGGFASIGGAGVFDGIFLVGVVSVFLTALF
ncbi:MAG: DUF1614 domain-containing protein [Chloroflexota bacterium]